MRDGFVFYRSFFESFSDLSKKDKLLLFDALCNYALNDIEPELSGTAAAMFKLLKPQVDANNRRYENGCKGGRPKQNQTETKLKPNNNQTITKPKPKDKEKDKDKDKVKDKEKASGSDGSSLSSFLIDYLNEKTGSTYEADGPTIAHIQFWLDNGYTQDQLRTVVDKKCAEWLHDDKMRTYLRPSTLFGNKFPEYLAAPISVTAEREQKRTEDRENLERMLSEKQQALSDLKESLVNADKTERRLLRENIAILEDSIGLIERRLA